MKRWRENQNRVARHEARLQQRIFWRRLLRRIKFMVRDAPGSCTIESVVAATGETVAVVRAAIAKLIAERRVQNLAVSEAKEAASAPADIRGLERVPPRCRRHAPLPRDLELYVAPRRAREPRCRCGRCLRCEAECVTRREALRAEGELRATAGSIAAQTGLPFLDVLEALRLGRRPEDLLEAAAPRRSTIPPPPKSQRRRAA